MISRLTSSTVLASLMYNSANGTSSANEEREGEEGGVVGETCTLRVPAPSPEQCSWMAEQGPYQQGSRLHYGLV